MRGVVQVYVHDVAIIDFYFYFILDYTYDFNSSQQLYFIFNEIHLYRIELKGIQCNTI